MTMGYCIHADGKPVTQWAHRPATANRPRPDIMGICDDHVTERRDRDYIVYPVSLAIKPAAIAVPGDRVLVDSRPATVITILTYPAPPPQAQRIGTTSADIVRVVVTERGNRRFTHRPGERYVGVEISGLCPNGISFLD